MWGEMDIFSWSRTVLLVGILKALMLDLHPKALCEVGCGHQDTSKPPGDPTAKLGHHYLKTLKGQMVGQRDEDPILIPNTTL